MRSVADMSDFGASANESVGCELYIRGRVPAMEVPKRSITEITPAIPQEFNAKRRLTTKARNVASPTPKARTTWVVPKKMDTNTQVPKPKTIAIKLSLVS